MFTNEIGNAAQVHINQRGESPRFQLLTGYSEWRVRHTETGGEYCIFETVVPPNTGVPIHRHVQHEDFYVLEGNLEVGISGNSGVGWTSVPVGGCIHVPGNAWHGFRNPGSRPTRMLTVALGALGPFFEEAGTSLSEGEVPQGAPSPEAIQHLRSVAQKYGHEFMASQR
jgi:quercetin dioxygenase-like cupin family protein